MRSDVLALGPHGGEEERWWPDTIRDFVAVADLAEAVARLALAPEPPELVNVCSGVGISFAAIVEALARRRGVPVTISSLDRPGIGAVVGDPTRLEQCTGFVPVMSADRVAACLLAERVPS
jgi:nucleoside-diphosphate-sugar epimerase